MPKKSTLPHLYLLLHTGVKPIELIALGYSKPTAYKYSANYKRVKLAFEKDLRRLGNNNKHGTDNLDPTAKS